MRNSQRCILYDRELTLLSRKKDRLYKIYLQKKTPKTKEKYHKLRNFYFHMLTQKKKEHMQSQFQKHQNNIRKTWQLMKNLFGKARNKFDSTSINYNGVLISKPVEVANSFNDHFSTIAKKLIDNSFITIYLSKSIHKRKINTIQKTGQGDCEGTVRSSSQAATLKTKLLFL